MGTHAAGTMTDRWLPLRRATPWLPWLVVLFGVGAYINSLSAPFLFDDGTNIVRDSSIESLWPLSDLLGNSRRPVLKLSLAISHALHGRSAAGFRVDNITIHILAGLALMGIVRRTLEADRLRPRYGHSAPLLAVAVALIWLVHPLQTQAVTYIIQRTEALMGLFYLLTLYCTIRAAEGQLRWLFGGLAVLACGLGMGTKEVMVTAPVVALLYDRTFLAGSFLEALKRRWGLYLGLMLSWGVMFAGVGARQLFRAGGTMGFGMEGVTPAEYLVTQPAVLLHYLRLAVWPHPLCFDYGWPAVTPIEQAAVPTVIVVALMISTVCGLVYRPWLGCLAALVFVPLAPSSSIVPLVDAAFEYRMYLPLAPLVVLMVIGIDALAGRMWRDDGVRLLAGAAAFVTVAILLSAVSLRRNYDYRSALSIWRTVVQQAPLHYRGHNNLGNELMGERRREQAIHHYRTALELKPGLAEGHRNLGRALVESGRVAEAIPELRQALRLKADYADAHSDLGIALKMTGRVDEALGHLRTAVDLDPHHAKAHSNLGAVLAGKGKLADAIPHFRESAAIRPTFEAHYNLAIALQKVGEPFEARLHFSKAQQLRQRAPR